MQEIKFTLEQVQQLLGMISDAPLKYSLGPFNFIQEIAQAQLRETQTPPQMPPTPAE